MTLVTGDDDDDAMVVTRSQLEKEITHAPLLPAHHPETARQNNRQAHDSGQTTPSASSRKSWEAAAPRHPSDVGLNRQSQMIANDVSDLPPAGVVVVRQLGALAVAVKGVVRLLDDNEVDGSRSRAVRLAG